MRDANALVGTVFSGLSPLVIEDVVDEGAAIRVVARTMDGPVPCPVCGAPTDRVHGFHHRTVADVPADGRRVLVVVRVRRLACPVLGCRRQTFREQVPQLLERYQRRTSRLASQLGAVVKELAGRAASRLLNEVAAPASRSTALRMLLRVPLPARRVPRVLGVDDFALRRRYRYATVLIDAETGERIDVLPGRGADALEAWLREHPGVEIVCRDGSGAYGEAVRRALPEAVQVGDRWHIWRNLCEAVLKEVRAHSACWTTANPPRSEGVRAATTRDRWRQVHELLGKGVGLLECARRLNLALNTVKRYARVPEPEGLRRAPQYRPTLVDPYRDHLRARRAEDPAIPVLQLFREIKESGYTGSLNLLYRYITQGRAEGDRPVISPRRLARLMLTRPDRLRDKEADLLQALVTACPDMTELSRLVHTFAELLVPASANGARLTKWITAARAAGLPHLHSFSRGLELDRAAVDAGLTLPHHNGRTEGVNTHTKRIMRQMHGRAGFALLRHRILLA
ncbi:ISL3 family transposase [Kitasatospora sp. NPDC054768]|uniref:ISL3 family transposase n=1 Tax=Kitasatospora sp. NBC_01519 TaxID=2903576 RepID=UPI002F9140FB